MNKKTAMLCVLGSLLMSDASGMDPKLNPAGKTLSRNSSALFFSSNSEQITISPEVMAQFIEGVTTTAPLPVLTTTLEIPDSASSAIEDTATETQARVHDFEIQRIHSISGINFDWIVNKRDILVTQANSHIAVAMLCDTYQRTISISAGFAGAQEMENIWNNIIPELEPSLINMNFHDIVIHARMMIETRAARSGTIIAPTLLNLFSKKARDYKFRQVGRESVLVQVPEGFRIHRMINNCSHLFRFIKTLAGR